MTRGALTLFATGLLLAGTLAHAAQLDKGSCDALKGEQAELEKAGVRGTMAKGAAWAKSNLAADKLEQVRRLIEVDEQLLFRCQGKPLVIMPADPDADPAAAAGESKEGQKAPVAKADKDGAKTKAAPAKKAAAQPSPSAAPKPAKKAAAPAKADPSGQSGKEAAGPAAAKPKPKPKPKPKVDDAYRPPSEPSANPFAKEDGPATKN
jgi:hypothetical protein